MPYPLTKISIHPSQPLSTTILHHEFGFLRFQVVFVFLCLAYFTQSDILQLIHVAASERISPFKAFNGVASSLSLSLSLWGGHGVCVHISVCTCTLQVCVCMHRTVYSLRKFDCCCSLSIVDHAVMSMGAHNSPQHMDFISSEDRTNGWITRQCSSSVSFSRTPFFHNGCLHLYFHQQCVRTHFSLSPHKHLSWFFGNNI